MDFVKEYKPLPTDRATLGLMMMVKNEKKRLLVSLESVLSSTGVPYVDCMVIYDTGSTDNTIDIIKEFSEKYKINLYLKCGTFVNFSVSRNVLLDYGDTIPVDFFVLLDTNDEIRGGDALVKFVSEQRNTMYTRFLVCQQWWTGNMDEYYNVRLIRNKSQLRYCAPVHEYIMDFSVKDDTKAYKCSNDFVLYQDRTQDDDKSHNRFNRDKVLLHAEYKKDPTEPRTLFYLAQTCSCLNQKDEALYYYKLRTLYGGFWEEVFHAYLRAGDIYRERNNWDEALVYYMKAGEVSDIRNKKERGCVSLDRAEPYHKIAEHYMQKDDWFKAYSYARMACELPYPKHCNLFIDKKIYEYDRWSVLGIVAFYAGFFDIGKMACEKALESKYKKPYDESNLQIYIKTLEKLKKGEAGVEHSPTPPPPPPPTPAQQTKAQFYKNELEKLKNIPYVKAVSMVDTMWKHRNDLKNKH
jgi:glycosyltransferase involved in cell wall biosynthesis